MNNLKSVLENLKSEKIKDRQEALTSIREVFSQDKVVAKFHINRDGESNPKVWLPVFQALFTSVILEKGLATKKMTSKGGNSSATAQRRLSEVASTVRWLTERTVHLMNKKVAIAVFQHLSQMLASDRTPDAELFKPVALDYAKALKCIVLHTPHLEHLDDYLWVKVLEISFNVILGAPINADFAEDEEQDLVLDIDSDMYMDDDTEDVHGIDAFQNDPPETGTKRSRRDPTPTPILSPRKAKSLARVTRNLVATVSLEQVEFASLLAILLRSPVGPILSPDYPNLASGILVRLHRFLELYPADSSLLHDYLAILSSTLDHVSLNKKHDVETFARSAWDGLVSLWGTKDKGMKEGLVIVLRHLFEFVTCPSFSDNRKLPFFDCADGIGRLWNLLSGEADSRWGVDSLSLDSLRLQIIDRVHTPREGSGVENVFVASTFRAGWNFDAGQALSWAILELQADCAAKLFQMTESMQDIRSPGPSTHRGNKRIKLENPINFLLHSIQAASTPRVRNYHLQTLLFFVDRHWSILHAKLKQDVIDILLQYVAFDDGSVQSWVFLNFAAIAFAEGSRPTQKANEIGITLDSNMWDSIWTHAVRRTNLPVICRAACHAGQALLASFHSQNSKSLQVSLNSSRILLEIETLAKDMDVQGPSYPFDSVCIFLSQCLTIASQDTRLYRMHLEDKVLTWFIDTWKLAGGKTTRMIPYMTTDILLLLETICGLSKHSALSFQLPLPESAIVDSLVAEDTVKIIRNFLLHAKIPVFTQQQDIAGNSPLKHLGTNGMNVAHDIQLVAARGKERKISSFFLRILESLLAEWENMKDGHGHITAEMARQSLDIAVAAVAFESLLIHNGTAYNRQVIQSCSKVISLLVQLLNGHNWTVTEQLLVAQGLEPLIYDETSPDNGSFSEALSPPGTYSGIKEETLQRLLPAKRGKDHHLSREKLALLRVIWQIVDMQDTLQIVLSILRIVLGRLLNETSNNSQAQSMGADDKDGFGPIRITSLQSAIASTSQGHDGQSTRHLLRICLGFLVCGPFLRSPSAEPTRDKELTQIVITSAREQPERFRIVCPIFFGRVRQGILYLPFRHLDTFFDEFERLLGEYSFSRSETFQRLLLDLLSSTLGVWKSDDPKATLIHEKFRQLCTWLSKALRTQKIRSWTLRDALARFLDNYLSEDPTQQSWASQDEANDDEDYQNCLPTSLLPTLNGDPDMRVRFRAAVINSRLYELSSHLQLSPLGLYDNMKQSYTVDVHNTEHMLTRMLSLGNIMVVSSAVRRGPYWHLLETCIHSQEYSKHIEAILTGVSERLGFASLSVLFDAYASQLAYSVRQSGSDYTAFPPHLLGYKDRKQSAEAAFRPFTPTNVLTKGRQNFESHCKSLQRTTAQGLQDCFGDIVGFHVLIGIDVPESNPDTLWNDLKAIMAPLEDLKSFFQENVDGIVAMLLRSLGDQDFSDKSSVVSALRSSDPTGKSPSTFLSLNRYRASDTFQLHEPNLPNFSAQTILKGFHWIASRLPDAFTSSTTYHILHDLMNDIHRTPLVNEQNRLFNAMTLWMAYRRQDLEDITILHTVIHGATSLLLQSDLARSAQSILEWSFRSYRSLKIKESYLQKSCLPDVLIRICCVARDYAGSNHQPLAEMGHNLLTWIDLQLCSFSEMPTFDIVVHKALAAWPFPPSSTLLPIYHRITMTDLSSVLEDHHITTNKFRLVRRIKENALDYGDGGNQYSKIYFWRLKECMPPAIQLQDEDVASFTALLSMNRGKISSFNPELSNHNVPRHRHCLNHAMKRKDGPSSSSSREAKTLILCRDAITLGLLLMLKDANPLHVSNAYRTLRLIVAIPSLEHIPLPLPSEYHIEIQYLKSYRRSPTNRPVVNICESLKSEIYLTSVNDFPRWISLISILLSDTLNNIDAFFGQISSILATDIPFAQEVFPILVAALLQLEKGEMLQDYPFKIHEVLSDYFSFILSSTSADVSCIRSIVDTALHLRYFSPAKTRDALAYNKWLNLDYTLLAKSAILCGAYTTALLFIETALEDDESHEDIRIEEVLYEIYAHIDEPDGFYGIKTKDLQHFLIKRFHHEKQWDKAFRFHGAALEAGSTRNGEGGLLESFHHFGFDHLAIETLRNLSGRSPDAAASSSMNYKLAWRTETWDLPDQTKDVSSAPLYRSLKAIFRERDPHILRDTIQTALLSEMGHLRSLGSENLAEIRSVSQDLMCLGQVLLWKQENSQQLLEPKNMVIDKWKDFTNIDQAFAFSDLEALMATRISLIRSVRQREERQQIGSFTTSHVRNLKNIEKNCLLRLSEAARASGQVQIALNSVIRAQRLDEKPSSEVSEEFANVLWLQKEETLAVRYLQRLVDTDDADGKDQIDASRKALWLSRLGTWTSEACLEKPSEISKRYFDRSIILLENVRKKSGQLDASLAKIYRECAMFAERQYHSTLKSPDAIRWKVYVDRKKHEIHQRDTELRSQTDVTIKKGLLNEQNRAQKLLAEDSELFKRHNTLRDTLLKQAIDMHSRCLETSSDFDNDSVTRFCSLWFANFDDESILDCVKVALARTPSRKLIFLAHQITARVSISVSSALPQSQENLQTLVVRMCQEHPFHILYQVYCLSDHLATATIGRRRSGYHSSPSTQTDRGTAASNIFDRLRSDETMGQRVQDVEKLCDACLQWASYPIAKDSRYKKTKGVNLKIPNSLKILALSNLRVPVTTARTPLDLTMQYNDCVWIQGYEATFDTAGGINLPKISICLGSDGQRYKQLFKGEGHDDLRQDAVMEQVFDLVNSILKRDRETRRRELTVREYKVIPLSSQAGLLEFVGNTAPLGTWLLAKHPHYRPHDLKAHEIQAEMKEIQTQYSNDYDRQLEHFLEARKRFKPVMRHYFTEKHKNSISWFQMRLNYTRSVATTSIVGHILGLGDRHVSNILMDNVSGEVVHIDLGIAFDQGKLLTFPERVPFRMTADMVDGMGPSGTSGVFQRCAEETLRVLRDESGVIMTVLEVFKHDPLHSWTASEIKVKQAQSDAPPATALTNVTDANHINLGIGLDMSSGSADEAADRALSSVARKLDKSLSVESTINELVAEATDPMNLARIFSGWSPYL